MVYLYQKQGKRGYKMKIVKASTALGKRLIQTGQRWEGTFLNQVYDKWSAEKEEAWNKCWYEYCNTEGAEQFGICSHNTFNFTVSWFTPKGMRLETSKNSYLVVFDE